MFVCMYVYIQDESRRIHGNVHDTCDAKRFLIPTLRNELCIERIAVKRSNSKSVKS